MSDLISRSKLLQEIETWGGCVEALHEYISNMPTAYNVDAVLAELEKAESVISLFDFESQKRIGLVYLDSAIDIVRKGGAT